MLDTLFLSMRFPNNDRMVRYDSLPHILFSETLISGSVSNRGKKYSQMHGASFGWAQDLPMTKKGDTHETISLLFKRVGVPPEIIVDRAKEQILGKFNNKLKEANFHLRHTKTYSLWSNAVEGTIHEAKKGSSRKIICTGYPKKLWYHCLELEALICSNTALDIYMLYGEVPETVMKGQASDISHIWEFFCYQWVMFRDVHVQYPADNLVLGHYLGPA